MLCQYQGKYILYHEGIKETTCQKKVVFLICLLEMIQNELLQNTYLLISNCYQLFW